MKKLLIGITLFGVLNIQCMGKESKPKQDWFERMETIGEIIEKSRVLVDKPYDAKVDYFGYAESLSAACANDLAFSMYCIGLANTSDRETRVLGASDLYQLLTAFDEEERGTYESRLSEVCPEEALLLSLLHNPTHEERALRFLRTVRQKNPRYLVRLRSLIDRAEEQQTPLVPDGVTYMQPAGSSSIGEPGSVFFPGEGNE